MRLIVSIPLSERGIAVVGKKILQRLGLHMAVAEDNAYTTFMTLHYPFGDAFIGKVLVLRYGAPPENAISIFEHSFPAGDSVS